MGLLKLFVDVSTKQLVLSDLRPEPFRLPDLFQGDTYSLEVTFVQPDPSGGLGSYTKIDVSAYSIRVGIGAAPIGNTSVSPAALSSGMTWDSVNLKFTGILALNTAGINTLISGAAAVTSYFEVELKVAATGYYETMFQSTFTLKAELIEDVPLVPVVGDSQLGKAEAAQTYVPLSGAAGQGFTLKSPDGSKTVLIYLDNNGVLHQDLLT